MFNIKVNNEYYKPILQIEKDIYKLLQQEYVNQLYFDELITELKKMKNLNGLCGVERKYFNNLIKRYGELDNKQLLKLGRLLRGCKFLRENEYKQFKYYQYRDVMNHKIETTNNVKNVVYELL